MSRFSYKDLKKIGRPENITAEWEAVGVSTDSRTLVNGNIFFALPGGHYDGHHYVNEVFQKDAAACVVSETWYEQNKRDVHEKKIIVVQDTLAALQNFAKLHRQRSEASVVAITGTNGKTTCKEMTCAVLSKNFKTIATQGNLNNEIGVPLTLLKIEDDTQVAVIEMGADKKGDIALLCSVAQPDSGVITNIGTAHLQSFGSIDVVAETKGELFDALSADGVRFVNMDDVRLNPYSKQTKGVVTFGFKNEANYRGEIISINEQACAKMRVHAPENHTFDIQLNVPGVHLANNALIAAAIGFSLGMDDHDIVAALENYKQPSNRLGIRFSNGFTVIDDTYNANPESMRAAIDTLMSMKQSGRTVAVLSDMLELGAVSGDEHAKVGAYIVQKKADALFVTGNESKRTFDSAKTIKDNFYFEKKNDLIDQLRKFIKPGDTVLVKGSRGMKMEDVVTALVT